MVRCTLPLYDVKVRFCGEPSMDKNFISNKLVQDHCVINTKGPDYAPVTGVEAKRTYRNVLRYIWFVL